METSIKNVKGTEYIEDITWVTSGTPRKFVYYVYRVDDDRDNPKSTFRCSGKLGKCRESLNLWAARKRWNLVNTSTVHVKRKEVYNGKA